MPFVRTWLAPRVAFWVIWTAWLWCLQTFLLARWEARYGYLALLFIVGPPVLISWIGSRLVRNPLDSPNALFWKGVGLSCFLGAFANMFLMKGIGWGPHVLILAGLIFGYLGLRGAGSKRVAVTQGELFERAQFIARCTGVVLRRVVVFKSAQDVPSAFAQRNTGAILLADKLLRLLSRRETEAVMAHEAAHLRPMQRMVTSAVPLLAAFSILLAAFFPEAKMAIPFLPIASLMLWRALRRIQEYDADANAVRATGDGEALITALTRISSAVGMPLHWGPLAGIFLPHPPMTARFRAIARKAGISAARVDEVIADVGVIPALPGFASPFGESLSPTGILAVMRERLDKRMMVLTKGFPIVAGVAFVVAERRLSPDFLMLMAHTVIWCAASIVAFWALYEVTVGSERRRLRDQLPDAYREGSVFAGVSTAAEPRYYEGLYHYDLGLVRIDGGALHFIGTKCSFAIGSSEARRVWVADGPRHWTPRKVVCIEYQMDDGKLGVVSLQSMERWFWPGTSAAAQELFVRVTQWSKSGERADATSPPPEVVGAVLARVGIGVVVKSMRVSLLVSFCAGWFVFQMGMVDLEGMLTPVGAPVVTGALILFFYAPHMEWGSARPAPTALAVRERSPDQ